MKKVLVIVIVGIILSFSFSTVFTETVAKQETTIHFPDVSRVGIYTGEVNEEGQPDGHGFFEATNGEGIRYIVVGDWENGCVTGEAWQVWEDGTMQIGTFRNGSFIKGKISQDAEMYEYNIEDDVYVSGYNPDSIFTMNIGRLDDDSIISLFSNIFHSEPIMVDGNYAWDGTGYTFCGLDMQYGLIMVENNTIQSACFSIVETEWEDYEQLNSYIEEGFSLIERANARIGKRIVSAVDNTVIGDFSFDEQCKQILIGNAVLNGDTRYTGVFSDTDFVVVMDIHSKISASNPRSSNGDNTIQVIFMITR